jgi:predicted nucleic acid-binding protein
MTEWTPLTAIYLETNFFIKAVEGDTETSAPPKRLIDFLRGKPGLAYTSEITFGEVLAPPRRPDALPLHVKRRAYLDLLLWSGFITLIPVSRDLLIETADLRLVSRQKLPDAIHLVSAIHRKCRYLVSSDNDFRKLPKGMLLVKPDVSGVDHLLAALA